MYKRGRGCFWQSSQKIEFHFFLFNEILGFWIFRKSELGIIKQSKKNLFVPISLIGKALVLLNL